MSRAPSSAFAVAVGGVAIVVLGFVGLLLGGQRRVEGPVPIVWDKEACAHCHMHIGEPPFAALSYAEADYPASMFTLGGLATLPDGRVLDADGTAIPGLYAAGRTACGIPRWGDGYSSGMSLGDSTFFGRQAGRHAARGS